VDTSCVLVPTLPRGNARLDALRPVCRAAERLVWRSHAERGNEGQVFLPRGDPPVASWQGYSLGMPQPVVNKYVVLQK
jgi:hypothetical protein